MSGVLSGLNTMSESTNNPIIDLQKSKIRFNCVENDINFVFDLGKMAAILKIFSHLAMSGVLSGLTAISNVRD